MRPGRRLREQNHEDSEEETMEYSQFQPSELDTIVINASCSGTVERLYLRNFMCHAALEVTFNPRVNFVVGRNGSGKSAILLALVVGLGGKASATNRGSSLKDFVKKGEKGAVVEVTLNNAGINTFRPEVYGERITVVRSISAGVGAAAAGYKLKSATGAVISTKRADLERMLETLKIQVDNPVAVLNQDTSREFLNSADPSAKYSLFMRATQMDVIIGQHANALETRMQATAALTVKQKVMEQQAQCVAALRARFRALQSVPEQRKRVEALENEIAWAQVGEKEGEAERLEGKAERESGKLATLQAEGDDLGKQGVGMKEQHQELKARLEELRGQLAEMEGRFDKAKTAHAARKELATAAQRDHRAAAGRVQRQQGDAVTLREEIQRLEQTTGPDYLARRQREKEEIARTADQLAQAQATLATGDLHIAQLRANQEPLREGKHAACAEAAAAARALASLQRQLESLARDRGNLAVFGPHAVPLSERIEAAFSAGQFSRRPVGPIGAHVRLRDADQRWSGAIEQALGGLLASYAVHDARDRATLLRLMGEVVGDRRKPTIINSRFMDQKHDTSRQRVAPINGVLALMDVLVIDDVQAFNTLVDHAQIEKVLLVDTQAQALRMMQDERSVPRNCARGLIPNGDVYYPAPNYRTYAGKRGYTSRYLQVSAADRIQQLRAGLAAAVAADAAARTREAELTERLAALGAELAGASAERTKVARAQQRLAADLARLRDLEEPDYSSLATLTAELAECVEQLAAAQAAEAAAAEKFAAAVADLDAAKAAAAALRDEARQLAQAEPPLVEEMEGIRAELTASRSAQDYHARRLADQKAATDSAAAAAAAKRAEAADLARNAEEVAPRIQPQGTVAQLSEKKRQLEAGLRSLELDSGNYVAVGIEYTELKRKYRATNARVIATHSLLKRLGRMMRSRASIYENVRRLVSWVVQHYFHTRLALRKYTGSLKIDHVAKTLVIEVAPGHRGDGDGDANKDTRTLSGGERSYSTVVFIMALWDSVLLPFYFMDEFDVFMDKVNRKVIMSMLMDHAKRRVGHQFVFLTPQEIASVATDEDVTIHRMENPRE